MADRLPAQHAPPMDSVRGTPAAASAEAVEPPEAGPLDPAAPGTFDRIKSFRFTYIAIATFILLYIFTVKGVEGALARHFESVVANAIEIDNFFTPPSQQIKDKLDLDVQQSAWVSIWDLRVGVFVLARDGVTWLYVDGHAPPPSPDSSVEAVMRQAQSLLPATGEVFVSVPHNTLLSNTILVAYAALLVQLLYVHNRRLARREEQLLTSAFDQRDSAAEEAGRIEDEIETIRERLMRVEPTEREHQEEIESLQTERERLETQLASLSNRERELRGKAEQAVALEQERSALEELLDEATSDLSSKDTEIRELERNLKRATRGAGSGGGRGREAETLGKRIRTLYKNVEIDNRAIEDLVALRDESTKLRAEECIKRLSEEADNVAVRRKVGGLPSHLSIYELGFAGKRRIYYTKGQQRRFRVLVIGAKNTQPSDLDYISRLSKAEVS